MNALDRLLGGFSRRPPASTPSAEDYEAGEQVEGSALKPGEYRRSPSMERPPAVDFEDTRAGLHWVDSPLKLSFVVQAQAV